MYELTVVDSNKNKSKLKYDQKKHSIYLEGQDEPLELSEENKKKLSNNKVSNTDCIIIQNENKINITKLNKRKKSVRILLGKKCNFNCKYCYQPKIYDHTPVSENLADEIVRIIGKQYIDSISLWGGESFLYLDEIENIIEQFKKYETNNTKYRFSTCTNGLLLKHKRIRDFVLKYNIGFAFSHDGPGQILRNEEDPLDNREILNFLIRHAALQNDNPISLNPVMSKLNYDHKLYFEFIKNRLGTDRFTIGEGRPIMISSERDIENTVPYDYMPTFSKNLFKYLIDENFEHMFSGVKKIQVEHFLNTINTPPKIENTICFVGDTNTLVIDTEGNLIPCQTFSKSEIDEDTGLTYSYGNIKDLDSNLDKMPIGNLSKSIKRKENVCPECMLFKLCNGACPYGPNKYFDLNCYYYFYNILPLFQYIIFKLTNKILVEFNKID